MTDVFVGYARADRERVDLIVGHLRAEGWNVWYDDELEAGETYRTTIREQIRAAKVAIVVWSKPSSESDWVVDEAVFAKSLGKLVPVRIDNAAPPLGFGGVHTHSLAEWDGTAHAASFQTLIRVIRKRLEDNAEPVLDSVLADAAKQRAPAESTGAPAGSREGNGAPIFDVDSPSEGASRAHADAPHTRQSSRSRIVLVVAGVLVAVAAVTFGVMRLVSGGGEQGSAPESDVVGWSSMMIPSATGTPSVSSGPVPIVPSVDPSSAAAAISAGDSSTPGVADTEPSPSSPAGAAGFIESPADGASVAGSVQIHGTASLPVDAALWIVIEPPDNSIHLTTRAPVIVDDAGQWFTTAGVGQGDQDAGKLYTLYAVVAPRVGSIFSTYVQDGRTGGLADMPADVTQLDSVRVTLG